MLLLGDQTLQSYTTKPSSMRSGLLPYRERKVPLKVLVLRDAGPRSSTTQPSNIHIDVVKLTQKEGEMKEEVRWFRRTTFFNRLRMQIIKYNVTCYMKLFCPTQAMTPTTLELYKRLYTFNRLKCQQDGHHSTMVLICWGGTMSFITSLVCRPSQSSTRSLAQTFEPT